MGAKLNPTAVKDRRIENAEVISDGLVRVWTTHVGRGPVSLLLPDADFRAAVAGAGHPGRVLLDSNGTQLGRASTQREANPGGALRPGRDLVRGVSRAAAGAQLGDLPEVAAEAATSGSVTAKQEPSPGVLLTSMAP